MKANPSIATGMIRFRSLFENTPELILYQDKNSTILDANPAFLHLISEPREQVINHNFDEFLPEQVRTVFREKLRQAFTGITVRFDMHFAYKNTVSMLGYRQGTLTGRKTGNRCTHDCTRHYRQDRYAYPNF